jgi:hypothetical protein
VTYKIDDRVRCKRRGCEHTVTAVSTGPFGEKLMLHDGYDWLEASLVELVACVPDDAQESYEQRRKRIAAERNPGQGWPQVPFGTWPEPDTRGEGIDRAVRNLSQVEHRVGAARFSPEER